MKIIGKLFQENKLLKKLILGLIILSSIVNAQIFEVPHTVLKGIPFSIKYRNLDFVENQPVAVFGVEEEPVYLDPAASEIKVRKLDDSPVIILQNSRVLYQSSLSIIPGWLSLLPPLIAIALALLTKEMLLSLFTGIWAGVTILMHYNPVKGFFGALDTYVVRRSEEHTSELQSHSFISYAVFCLKKKK